MIQSDNEDLQLYCICQKEWEDGVRYFGCDYCDDWVHPQCVGIPADAQGIERYKCPKCIKNGAKEPIDGSATLQLQLYPFLSEVTLQLLEQWLPPHRSLQTVMRHTEDTHKHT